MQYLARPDVMADAPKELYDDTVGQTNVALKLRERQDKNEREDFTACRLDTGISGNSDVNKRTGVSIGGGVAVAGTSAGAAGKTGAVRQ